MCAQSILQWQLKTLKNRRRRVELDLTTKGGSSGLGKVIAGGSVEGSRVGVELDEGEAALDGYSMRGKAVSWSEMRMYISIRHCSLDQGIRERC